jgi:dihydroxyacetone kinase-like predicted kinase
MKPQEYLDNVLKSQTLAEDSEEIKALQIKRAEVQGVLEKQYGTAPTIRYGGSRAKGTMIRESFDLDIICYFGSEDTSAGRTLKEIYNYVKEVLAKEYYVEPKKSSLRLLSNEKVDFHVDVVPGRFTDKNNSDAFLFQATGEKERLQTNLQKHIDYVKTSKLTDTIKLVKYWKILKGIQIKTFALELLVIESLEGYKDDKGLDKCLTQLFDRLANDTDNIKIEDPANPQGNDLSELLNPATKGSISLTASNSLVSINDDKWEDVFGQLKSNEVASIKPPTKTIGVPTIHKSTPAKPWARY